MAVSSKLKRFKGQLCTYLLVTLLLTTQRTQAQSFAFGIRWTGLAIHPKKGANEGLYKTTVGKQGTFVTTSGITISAEVGIWRQLGIKVAQALVWKDCAGRFAMLSHIGLNFGGAGATLGHSNHSISGSVGPMLYRRKSWRVFPGYVPSDDWLKSGRNSDWETRIIPIAGQFEYNYFFSENYGVGINILPGYPDIISVVAGPTIRQGRRVTN